MQTRICFLCGNAEQNKLVTGSVTKEHNDSVRKTSHSHGKCINLNNNNRTGQNGGLGQDKSVFDRAVRHADKGLSGAENDSRLCVCICKSADLRYSVCMCS